MRFPRTQIVTLVNQKGGCGKTTSTVGLAVAFSKLGYKTCVVDVDAQRNTTTNFLQRSELNEQGKLTVADAVLKQVPAIGIAVPVSSPQGELLSIIPGHEHFGSVIQRLELELQGRIAEGLFQVAEAAEVRNRFPYLLRDSLKSLRGIFDVVIIDTPPALDFALTSALVAADWFIIPTFISKYDFNGLERLWKTATKIQEKMNRTLRFAGVLVGNFDSRTVLDRNAVEELRKEFGPEGVFQTLVKRSVKLRHSTFQDATIFESEIEGAEDLQEQFLQLAKEMINRGTKSATNQTMNPLPTTDSVKGVVNG